MGLRQKYRAWRLRKYHYIEQVAVAQLSEGSISRSLLAPPEPRNIDHTPLRPVSASQLNRFKRQKREDTRPEACCNKDEKNDLTNSISNPILRSSFHKHGPVNPQGTSPIDGVPCTLEVVEELATMTRNLGIEQPSADFGVWASHRPKRDPPTTELVNEQILESPEALANHLQEIWDIPGGLI